MGNTYSYYPCQEQTPFTHNDGALTVISSEHKVDNPTVANGYVPSSEALEAFKSLEQKETPTVPVAQASEDLSDLNSIITIDLLNFDLTFPCPLCAAIGENVQLTVISLSDHVGRHKYEQLLAEKMTNVRTGTAEMDLKQTHDDKSSEEDSDTSSQDDKLITGRQFWNARTYSDMKPTGLRVSEQRGAELDSENAFNQAIRESARENEVMGHLSEEAALAAAIAASVETAKPEHNAHQPVVIVTTPMPVRAPGRVKSRRIEANDVANVEVDCD